jgi:CelD/BcsL family acetyltransferase involved in cellulose biosynthesis
LELAGAGVSDYLAPIVRAAISESVLDALDEALGGARLPVRFHDVPCRTPWVAVARKPHSVWSISSASVCPLLRLQRDPAAWRRMLPSGLQRNLRRYGNRIVDECGARFCTIDDPQQADRAIDALMDVHTRRWHAQRRPGVFAAADVRRFHRSIAPALIRRGVLRLHIITIGDAIIAAQYVLQDSPHAFSYIGGFDPEWGHYSPGTLLMAYSIERAIDDGCTSFDLLRGREPYKYAWGAHDTYSLTLTRSVNGP